MKHTLAILAVMIGSATLSSAAPLMLTVTQVDGKVYQQTEQNPCIFEIPNCHQPSGFSATAVPNMGNVTSWDLWSVVYTGAQLNAFLDPPGSLTIGLDLNDTSVAQSLVAFDMYINSNLVACLNPTGPTSCTDVNMPLLSPNNGQGWADFLVTGFPSFTANDQIQFRWAFGTTGPGLMPANDGGDNAFIVGATSMVPEPTTWMLMGSGLIALGLLRRRQSR